MASDPKTMGRDSLQAGSATALKTSWPALGEGWKVERRDVFFLMLRLFVTIRYFLVISS